MSEIYKVFDDSGLTALTNHMKTTRTKANSNEAAIETLGEDLVELSSEVVAALSNKQDKLTFDSAPTSGSTNPVTSTGVKTYVDNNFAAKTHGHDFSELTVTDTEAAKTALAIENGMVLKDLQAKMPSFTYWKSITYGNGKFVAVAVDTAVAAYSEDGITWIEVTMPRSAKWCSVAYGNGKFVAISGGSGYSSTIAAYSDDGITWIEVTMPSSNKWHYITYGNGRFVVIPYGSNIAAYSDDGITWTETTMPASKYWSSVAYGNGRFVAISGGSNSRSSTAAYSDDGIIWTEFTMRDSTYWDTITYGNGRFVAFAISSSTAAYSDDGIAWTRVTMSGSAGYTSVICGNGRFVVTITNSTTAAYSDDGITWIETTMPSSAKWDTVTYGNGKFVTIAHNGDALAYSYDGITWHDSVQYISQNGEDVTATTLIALDHTHDEYALADHTHDEVPEHEHLFDRGVTTEGDGAAYTATVSGIESLEAGISFIMIPHTASTSKTCTLNINGIGAKMLRRPISSNNVSTVAATADNWITANRPIRVMYNGTYWLVMDMARPNAPDLYGTVPAECLTKAAAVNDAIGDTPTAAEFNALLASLRAAGYLET